MNNARFIALLNDQFNREVSMLLRFLIEAAALNDPDHEAARKLYLRDISEKVEQAQYLADQIVTLGGTPTLKPDPGCPPTNAREMLKHDAAEEETDERNYLQLAGEAEHENLPELKQKLELQSAEEHHRSYEMRRLLW